MMEKPRKKYLLPKLKKEEFISNDYDNLWALKDNVYDFLLDNLESDYEPIESVFDDGNSSIPHIFEHVITFNRAFYDINNRDHKRAVMEWKAVFSILALKRIKNINLNIIKVDLSGTKNPFIAAASMFKPEDEHIIYNATWDFIYILIYKDEPIALFSPITIVCPAKLFLKKIKDINWIDIVRRNNKEELIYHFKEKSIEFSSIKGWVNKLKKEIRCNPDASGDAVGKYEHLEIQINKFIKELSINSTDEDEIKYKTNIYTDMNNEIRKEYDYLNICCDFIPVNDKLTFLIDKYLEDVFTNKLIIILYDDKPDSIYNMENIDKLEKIFGNVLKINSEKVISVEEGGDKVPFFALMPFKIEFISEILKNEITAEEFIEEYKMIYNQEAEEIEVNLTIKGFPYSFKKNYYIQDWHYIYANKLLPVSIWPNINISGIEWNVYYTYIYLNSSNINIDIPYDKAEHVTYTPDISPNSVSKKFQIIKTDLFPSYIRIKDNEISGYLPIETKKVTANEYGANATIYVDIGHSSMGLSIIKNYKNSNNKMENEIIDFSLPISLPIIINEKYSDVLNEQFIPNEDKHIYKEDTYFKNMLHSFYDYTCNPNKYSVNPFINGQVVFMSNINENMFENFFYDFINYDFYGSRERERKNIHIFIEQILLFAVYKALLMECTTFNVKFLHEVTSDDKLGELKGLWNNVFTHIKDSTGMKNDFAVSIKGIYEHEALAYYVLKQLSSQSQINRDNPLIPVNEYNVGLDIGTKKTIMTYIYSKKDDPSVYSKYSIIPFAGRDISILNDHIKFKEYKNILSVLLGDSYEISIDNTWNSLILNEFDNLYKNCEKELDYYYGLFDLIAMKIEEKNFKTPPDVFNRKPEFDKYIKIITNNVLLLFFEIGCLLGKMVQSENPPSSAIINIYLGGNAAKFLYWISNKNESKCIDETNEKKFFIVNLQHSILEIIKTGLSLFVNLDIKEINCKIEFSNKIKKQLIEGFIDFDNRLDNYRNVVFEQVDDSIDSPISDKVINNIQGIRDDVFKDNLDIFNSTQSSAEPIDSLTEKIIISANETSSKVIDYINEM